MRYTTPIYPGDGERFAPNAFAKQVGKRITIRDGDKKVRGRLLSAAVNEDGEAARLVMEVADGLTADQRKLTGRPPGRPPRDSLLHDRGMSMGG